MPYALAAIYAKEKKLNDSLVLNTKGNMADFTTTNVFILKGEKLVIPFLAEGCVAGGM